MASDMETTRDTGELNLAIHYLYKCTDNIDMQHKFLSLIPDVILFWTPLFCSIWTPLLPYGSH